MGWNLSQDANVSLLASSVERLLLFIFFLTNQFDEISEKSLATGYCAMHGCHTVNVMEISCICYQLAGTP